LISGVILNDSLYELYDKGIPIIFTANNKNSIDKILACAIPFHDQEVKVNFQPGQMSPV